MLLTDMKKNLKIIGEISILVFFPFLEKRAVREAARDGFLLTAFIH